MAYPLPTQVAIEHCTFVSEVEKTPQLQSEHVRPYSYKGGDISPSVADACHNNLITYFDHNIMMTLKS